MKPISSPFVKSVTPLMVVLALVASGSFASASEPTAVDSDWARKLQKYLEASRAEHNHHIVQWQEVAAWSFDDGKMPGAFKVCQGEWEVKDGRLRSVSGQPDGNREIKIANCQWPAFRLEFDVTMHAKPGVPPDHIGEVGVAFNADPDTGSFQNGYAVLVGSYFNQVTVLYRLFIPYARTEWSPIVPGRTHRIALEVVKPHIRCWVDDRIVLEGWERGGKTGNGLDASDFLDMDPKRAIVLHTYDTVMEVDNLRISVPGDKEAAGKP